jgi:MFS family permease
MTGRRPARWIRVAIVVYGLGMIVMFADMAFPVSVPGYPDLAERSLSEWMETSTWALLAFSFFAAGALITLHRPLNPIGRLLLVAATTFSLGVAVGSSATHLAARGWLSAAGIAEGVAAGLLTIWLPLLLGTLILFPVGRLLSASWRWLAWLTGAFLVLGVAASLVNGGWAGDVEEAVFPNPLREPLAPLGDLLTTLWTLAAPAVALSAAVSLIIRYRRSRGEERQQMKWLAFTAGGVATALPLVIVFNPTAATDSAWTTLLVGLVFVSIPVAITVAVMKYRLYDIDRILNRTLVYVIVVGILAGVFGAVAVLPTLVVGTGETPSWVIATSTLVVAALFNPLRKRVQRGVDRRFNRSRYHARDIADEFSLRLRDQVDPAAVSAGWVGVAQETMQPASAGVWVRGAR